MKLQPRMRDRRTWGALALTVAALTVPSFAFGGSPATQVTVRDDSFSPARPATVNFGGTFSWHRAQSAFNEHNVHQVAGLFKSGSPTTNSFTPAHPYAIKPSAGNYTYFCDAHRALGMVGTIKVRPILETGTLRSRSFGVQWASRTNKQTGTRFDVRYRVGGGNWKVWKNDTTSFHGTFGKHRRPVRVKPRRTYRIAVRSELQNTRKKSDWSPALSVRPPA
jgi:plastocyanin